MDTDHHVASAEPETPSVGSILRRCREFNNISLDDAAEATKIGKNYLRALEADRPQELPSPAYLRGFLRMYATYLGLEPDEVLQLASQLDGTPAPDAPAISQAAPRPGGFSWQRLVLPAVLLTAVIVSALVLSPSTPERPKQPAPPQALPAVPLAAVQPVRSSSSVLPPQPAEQAAGGQQTPPEAQVAPPKSQDGFMVRMKVNRNSSLSVVIDDAASQGYELTSGDLIEWKAARTISLDLSDAGSVDIELNGVPLKLQAAAGKPAYIVLDANGIRR